MCGRRLSCNNSYCSLCGPIISNKKKKPNKLHLHAILLANDVLHYTYQIFLLELGGIM